LAHEKIVYIEHYFPQKPFQMIIAKQGLWFGAKLFAVMEVEQQRRRDGWDKVQTHLAQGITSAMRLAEV